MSISFTIWLWEPRDAHTKGHWILLPPGEGQYASLVSSLFAGPSTSLWGLYSYTCSQVSAFFQQSVEHSFDIFLVLLTQPGIFSGSHKAWEHLLHWAFMLWSASGLRQNAPRPVLYRGLSEDRWIVDSSAWWHMPMILAVWYQGEGTGPAKPWIQIPPGLHSEFEISLCYKVAQCF